MSNDASEPRPDSIGRSPPAEKWDAVFGIAIGVFLMLWMPRIWEVAVGRGSEWTFSDAAGNPLSYTSTVYFPGDLAMALFSIALIVEGIVLLVRRSRPLIATCFSLTVAATLGNLAYVIYMMQTGYGFQLASGLATAVGLYVAGHQWAMLGRRVIR